MMRNKVVLPHLLLPVLPVYDLPPAPEADVCKDLLRTE